VLGVAMALEKTDDPMRFTTVAEQIAPLTKARYAPAHVWRARRILAADLTPEVARAGEVHLLHAIKLDPSNVEARMMLGRLYFVAQRFDDAVRNLEMAVETYPDDLLSLAKAHSAIMGHRPQAIRIAGQAIEYFTKVVSANPYNPNPEPRLRLAESYLFLEQFAQSLKVLQDGIARRDSPALRTATARVHLVWADRLAKEGESTESGPAADKLWANRLDHLQQAILADPNEMLAFQQVMGVLNQANNDSEALRTSLKEVLKQGKATPLIHLLLGTDAAVNKDLVAAATHLNIAFDSDPKMTIAANNLAWVLAYAEKPDFERSTALINAVLQKQPDEIEFHHTRGMILIRMEKWSDAVIELERSLSTHDKDKETRIALATAYEKLGLVDLANEQRKLITADAPEPTATDFPSQNP
jgi:tetratricopeptide (TPR) repeat protein